MVGAAVAAIGGVRRGRLQAQKEFRANLDKRMLLRKQLYKEEQEKIAAIMKLYDTDHSQSIEQNEFPKLLADANLEKFGRKGILKEDDIQALICLCDHDADGTIGKSELLECLFTWFAYMEHEERVSSSMQKFDLSGTGKIDNHEELKPLLVEINKGEDVPDDVVKWVYGEADVLQDGKLNTFELARAIAVWYAWVPPSESATQAMPQLAHHINTEAMPPRPPKKSSCCVVQ
jgi:Ca2+-binding EF-hand superfamily protein